MTTNAHGLTLLDDVQTLGYAAASIPSTGVASALTVSTTLTVTQEDGDRRGWADLKIREEDYEGESRFGFDANQARQLAAHLLKIADEIDARTADSQSELKAAA
ncbi:hypothetical protein [Citricoccus sp.]|uniref:hypothetical protein n=1 Tax=Citricoccus sp. TaxID=1978372 RepID=UPI0028BD1C17|nr:hypothetical protein [Citricoccus sp.]